MLDLSPFNRAISVKTLTILKEPLYKTTYLKSYPEAKITACILV